MSSSTGSGTIDKAIEQNANKYGVDSNLIYSIMLNESNFNPDVISSTSNKGLMQVSDELLADNNITGDNWTNPMLNVMVGTKYFSYLQKYFNGDLEKSIAAYNAGEGRVGRLVKQYGDNWKNYLPQETKNYLPKVMSTYKSMR